MKEQVIQYLAFDVHRATVVASLRDESGAVVMRATVPTEAPAILLLIKNAGPRVHLAFEEGTQAQWLHDLVAPHAEKVVVCNTRGQNGSGKRTTASTWIECPRICGEARSNGCTTGRETC